MKILDHSFQILKENKNILIPVFFHVTIFQLVLSYLSNTINFQDPVFLLQNLDKLFPSLFWIIAVSALLLLLVDSFFASMTLSMIFEGWKKGKTNPDFSYGARFFIQILGAKLIYGFSALFLLTSLALSIVFFNSPLLSMLTVALILTALAFFFFMFFWVNESIVARRKPTVKAFLHSKKITFGNLLLTLKTIFLIFAFYLIVQSLLNLFIENSAILVSLITLIVAILLKAGVSTLKMVSFLQAK